MSVFLYTMARLLKGAIKLMNRDQNIVFKRNCITTPVSSYEIPASPSEAQKSPPKDVPGLSKNVVDVPAEEVGPGASKQSTYKNPEYFCYNPVSYFEAEVEMMNYRLPQPSNN